MSMLLDALGWVGDSLDKPGRAARSLVHGLTGGNFDDVAAFIPFSDTMGWSNKANRVSGNEMLGAEDDGSLLSTIRGMGAEVATDPLMFAGAGLGRMLGGRAGEAAVARGPRYETTADDLSRMLAEGGLVGDTQASRRVTNILKSPDSDRLLSEINPQSKILGAGAEALTFTDDSGKVLRLGRNEVGTPGRPVSSSVMQPSSTVDVGAVGQPGWRAERTPMAKHVNDANYWYKRERDAWNSRHGLLGKKLESEKLSLGDPHLGNVGTHGGRSVVIDPGAVDALPGFAGERGVASIADDPGRLMEMLLNSVGADDAVRRAYASGLSGPNLRGKIGGYGAAGGADAGILARMLAGE